MRQHPANWSLPIDYTSWLLVAIMASVFGNAAAVTVFAQSNAQRQAQRREFLQQMLNTLIDSQLSPGPANPQPDRNQRSRPEVREVRANLAGFAQELSQMVDVLHQDVSRTDGLRELLGDALRVNASATLLARRSASLYDLGELRGEYRQLDQDWRLLSYRLRQLRYLSDRVRVYLDRGDAFNARLNYLLDVKPQVDRDELVRVATTISTDILTILEEIDFEIPDRRKRNEILLEGRGVYQQCRRVATLAYQNASYEAIRDEYLTYRELWSRFTPRVRQLNVPMLERPLNRIQAAHRKLHELLWLPHRLDRSDLVYLTDLICREMDQFLDGVTLRQLIEMNEGRDVILAQVSDFHGACGDFQECVQSGEEGDTLAELYYYLSDEWQKLSATMRRWPAAETRRQHAEIDNAITQLRDMLGVRPTLNRARITRVAAELENLTDHYRRDVRSAVNANRNQYSDRFRTEAVQASNRLHEMARQLHSQLAAGADLRSLRRQSQDLAQQWQTVNRYSERLAGTDRDHLRRVAQRLTPLLVDLQTTFTR